MHRFAFEEATMSPIWHAFDVPYRHIRAFATLDSTPCYPLLSVVAKGCFSRMWRSRSQSSLVDATDDCAFLTDHSDGYTGKNPRSGHQGTDLVMVGVDQPAGCYCFGAWLHWPARLEALPTTWWAVPAAFVRAGRARVLVCWVQTASHKAHHSVRGSGASVSHSVLCKS